MSDLDRRVYLLALIFSVALLPLAASYLHYDPDERHFPDGALRMLETDDFLTPCTGNGELRLKKPILGYWIQAASFAGLGVSPLSARLPCLISGAAIVVLTGLLALQVTRSTRASLIAAAIMACQLQVVFSSVRSVADLTLTLFLLVATLGVTASASRAAPWLLFVGVGLAVATKGLLPLAFLVVAGVWAARQAVWHRLVHPPAVAVGLFIAVSWYVVAWLMHGQIFTDQFLGDQFADKLRFTPATVATRLPANASLLMLGFLPFLLLLPELWVRGRGLPVAAPSPAMQQFRRLAVGWTIVVVVIFGFADRVNGRYAMPAAPLLALVLGDWLARANEDLVRAVLRRGTVVVCVLIVLCAAIGGVALMQLGEPGRAAFLGVGGLAVPGLIWLWKTPVAQFAVSVLALVSFGFESIRPFLGPEQSQQIARVLMEENTGLDEPILYLGKVSTASKVRVRAGGSVQVRWSRNPADLQHFNVAVIAVDDVRPAELTGWRVREIRAGLKGFPLRELLRSLFAGRLATDLPVHQKEYLVAIRAD